MPRQARMILGGCAYQILNRAKGRVRWFKKTADFADGWGVKKQDASRCWQQLDSRPVRIMSCVELPFRIDRKKGARGEGFEDEVFSVDP